MMDEIVDKMSKKMNYDKSMPTYHLMTPKTPSTFEDELLEDPAFKEPIFCSEDENIFEGFSTPFLNQEVIKLEITEAMTSSGQSIILTCKKSFILSNFWIIRQEYDYESRFCKIHKDVIASLTQTERELIDYCFSKNVYNKNKL